MCYYETIYYLFLFSKIRYSTEKVFFVLHSGNFIVKMQCLPVSLFSCTFHAPLPCQKRALEYPGKISTHPGPVNHGLLISLQLLETCVVNASVERIFCSFPSFLPSLIVTKLAEPYRYGVQLGSFSQFLWHFCFSFILFSFDFRGKYLLSYLFLEIQSDPSKQNLDAVFQVLQHIYSLQGLSELLMLAFRVSFPASFSNSPLIFQAQDILSHNHSQFSAHIQILSPLGICHLSGISFKLSEYNFKLLVGRMLR